MVKIELSEEEEETFFPVRITRGGPARHIMINSWHPFENLQKEILFIKTQKLPPPPAPPPPSAQPASLISQPYCPKFLLML